MKRRAMEMRGRGHFTGTASGIGGAGARRIVMVFFMTLMIGLSGSPSASANGNIPL